MTAYVEWVEPWSLEKLPDGGIPSICVTSRMTCQDAIIWMKYIAKLKHSNHPNYPYKSDAGALEDFIVINWAQIKEYPDVCPS